MKPAGPDPALKRPWLTWTPSTESHRKKYYQFMRGKTKKILCHYQKALRCRQASFEIILGRRG
jgi:hypothetical protein